jgi:hypothetical protein
MIALCIKLLEGDERAVQYKTAYVSLATSHCKERHSVARIQRESNASRHSTAVFGRNCSKHWSSCLPSVECHRTLATDVILIETQLCLVLY